MFANVLRCLTEERDRRCTSIMCYKICRVIQNVRPAVFLSAACSPGLGRTRFPVLLSWSTSSFRIDGAVQTHSDFPTQRRSQALHYLVCTRINSKIKHCSIWFPQDYFSVLRLVLFFFLFFLFFLIFSFLGCFQVIC
jgi:hypothetical protein